MAHAHCMQDTKGYKHTLRTCNTYCFFHCNDGCTIVSHWYVICTLPFLFTYFLPPSSSVLFPFILHPVFSLERLPPFHLILTRDVFSCRFRRFRYLIYRPQLVYLFFFAVHFSLPLACCIV